MSRFFKSSKPQTEESVKFSGCAGGTWSRGPRRCETAQKVVTYQGVRGILEPLRASCRSGTAVPESLRNTGAPRNFGALADRVLLRSDPCLGHGSRRDRRKGSQIKAVWRFVEALGSLVVDLQQKKPSWGRCAEFWDEFWDHHRCRDLRSLCTCGGVGSGSVAAPHLMANFRKNASMVVK